jgi:hypothetical protein
VEGVYKVEINQMAVVRNRQSPRKDGTKPATEEKPATAENKIIGEASSHRELHVH